VTADGIGDVLCPLIVYFLAPNPMTSISCEHPIYRVNALTDKMPEELDRCLKEMYMEYGGRRIAVEREMKACKVFANRDRYKRPFE